MSKRFSFVGSMSFTGVLVVLLIVILALATFVESSYGTRTAWALVYGTHWFEVLLAVMAVNLVAVMYRYKFFNRKKVVVLLFHLAFVLILAGAAITRFISYEGIMHIREQSMTNRMLSNNAYVEVTLQKGEEEVTDGREVMLTSLTPKAYRAGMNIGGDKVKIRSTGYITNAVEQFVEASGGEPLLQVVFVSSGQTTATLPSGSLQLILGMDVSFNNPDSSAVLRFFTQGDSVCMSAPFPISQMQMGAESAVRYEPWDTIAFREGWLYTVGHMRMAMQAYIPSAKRQVVAAPPGEGGGHVSAVQVELAYQGMKATVMVPGMPRIAGEAVTGEIGDLRYAITYGSREVELPFSLFLKDFVVDRYPGSNSPSSFASEVVLVDQEMGIQEDRRIFMNNVLKHRGYRFYQSSYDNDELGTVLSVNKDRAGTFVTYLGYLILMAGMLAALFVRGTRFARLTKISVATKKAGVVALLLLGGGMSLFAQSVPPKDEAQAFGALWVQDKGGRFEPMNTLSHEVVRKITQKSGYQEFSADQV
ncbi:MAG: cytochrome c biogenesis protein ResB, partial [Bacteroidales bacterium]